MHILHTCICMPAAPLPLQQLCLVVGRGDIACSHDIAHLTLRVCMLAYEEAAAAAAAAQPHLQQRGPLPGPHMPMQLARAPLQRARTRAAAAARVQHRLHRKARGGHKHAQPHRALGGAPAALGAVLLTLRVVLDERDLQAALGGVDSQCVTCKSRVRATICVFVCGCDSKCWTLHVGLLVVCVRCDDVCVCVHVQAPCAQAPVPCRTVDWHKEQRACVFVCLCVRLCARVPFFACVPMCTCVPVCVCRCARACACMHACV